MGDNLTPTQRAVRERSKAGDTMYKGQPAGDDLFEDISSKEFTDFEWVRKSPNSLTIDIELSESEWLAFIASVETIHRRYQWYLGDCLVYGIRREYGATAEQIAKVVDITGKDDKTLHDYYKTALLFEVSERSDILEFEQHRVLARAYSDDTPEHRSERLRWLKIAGEQKLSGRKLNTLIKAQLPAVSGTPEIDVSSDEPTPLPDENEEEATDKQFPPSPLDDDENWQSLNYLKTIARKKDYQNIDDERAKIIRKQIATARQFLSLLETYLPRSSKK